MEANGGANHQRGDSLASLCQCRQQAINPTRTHSANLGPVNSFRATGSMPSSRSMRLCRFVCCESALRVSGVPPEGVRAGLRELNERRDAEWVR